MTLSIPVDAAPGGDDGALAYLGGANLLTQTPGIRDWHPGTRLVLGSYAYARVRGGARATRARDGRDSVWRRVRRDAALAYLCSPTEVYVRPPAAVAAAAARLRAAPAWQRAISTLSRTHLRPNARGGCRRGTRGVRRL